MHVPRVHLRLRGGSRSKGKKNRPRVRGATQNGRSWPREAQKLVLHKKNVASERVLWCPSRRGGGVPSRLGTTRFRAPCPRVPNSLVASIRAWIPAQLGRSSEAVDPGASRSSRAVRREKCISPRRVQPGPGLEIGLHRLSWLAGAATSPVHRQASPPPPRVRGRPCSGGRGSLGKATSPGRRSLRSSAGVGPRELGVGGELARPLPAVPRVAGPLQDQKARDLHSRRLHKARRWKYELLPSTGADSDDPAQGLWAAGARIAAQAT